MEEFYTVVEIQNNGTTPGVLTYVYTDVNQAYSKWHAVLSVAAVSSVMYHSCSIIRASDTKQIEGKAYIHLPLPESE